MALTPPKHLAGLMPLREAALIAGAACPFQFPLLLWSFVCMSETQ